MAALNKDSPMLLLIDASYQPTTQHTPPHPCHSTALMIRQLVFDFFHNRPATTLIPPHWRCSQVTACLCVVSGVLCDISSLPLLFWFKQMHVHAHLAPPTHQLTQTPILSNVSHSTQTGALQGFGGAIVAITHNRAFATALQPTHILRVSGGSAKLSEHKGTLSPKDFEHTSSSSSSSTNGGGGRGGRRQTSSNTSSKAAVSSNGSSNGNGKKVCLCVGVVCWVLRCHLALCTVHVLWQFRLLCEARRASAVSQRTIV